jgi:aldehyde dehydrogenase (NAD+)
VTVEAGEGGLGMRVRDRLFVDGAWVSPSENERITLISPSTEEPFASVAVAAPADVDAAVDAAHRAFSDGRWHQVPPQDRGALLDQVATAVEASGDDLAEMITLEMGAPLLATRTGQIPVVAALLRYYAEMARTFEFEQKRTNGRATSIVRYEPVGVVAAIVPWNAPLLLTVLKLAPALAAGCSVVLKPAPESPLDAFKLAEIFQEAGLPDGVLNVVVAERETSEHLVRNPLVDKVSFTGSTAAGKRIAEICSSSLKRFGLELGGKSAAIVLDDAPIDKTVSKLVPLSLENSGQSCVAQTRILVSNELHDDFVGRFATAVADLRIGEPTDSATEIGPLVSERQRARVEDYIAVGRAEGAKVVLGGGRPQGLNRGWYVEPTVFTEVTNSMRIAQEEIFGPVVAVIRYSHIQEAVDIANDSIYGLGGSVWTADAEKGLDIARQIRTGSVRVNGAGHILETPAGGYKQSGQTREFGLEGLLQYLEQKSIAVRLPA